MCGFCLDYLALELQQLTQLDPNSSPSCKKYHSVAQAPATAQNSCVFPVLSFPPFHALTPSFPTGLHVGLRLLKCWNWSYEVKDYLATSGKEVAAL